MQDKLEQIYESKVMEMSYGLDIRAEPITQAQLVDMIKAADARGTAPISITAVTVPQQRKGGNVYIPIYKVSRINGMIGTHYEKSVNRQREREGSAGDFKRQSGWGKHETTSLVQGRNGLSIAIQPTPSKGRRESVYVGTQGAKFVILPQETWGKFINVTKPQYTADAQGVDRPVVYRRVRVNNVAGISMGGKEYEISDFDRTKQEVLKTSQLRDVDAF